MFSQDANGAGRKDGPRVHPRKHINPNIQNGDHKSRDTKDGDHYSDDMQFQAVKEVLCPICRKPFAGPTHLAFHLISAHVERKSENITGLREQELPEIANIGDKIHGAQQQPNVPREGLQVDPSKKLEIQKSQEAQKKLQGFMKLARDKSPDVDQDGLAEKSPFHPSGSEADNEKTTASLKSLHTRQATATVDGGQRKWKQVTTLLRNIASENAEVERQADEKSAQRIDQELARLHAQLLKDPFDEKSAQFQAETQVQNAALKREREQLALKLDKASRLAEQKVLMENKRASNAMYAVDARPAEETRVDRERELATRKITREAPTRKLTAASDLAGDAALLKSAGHAKGPRVAEHEKLPKEHELDKLERAEQGCQAKEPKQVVDKIATVRKSIDKQRRRDEENRAKEEARTGEERKPSLVKVRFEQSKPEDERKEHIQTVEEMQASARLKLAEHNRTEEEMVAGVKKVAATHHDLAHDCKALEERKAVHQRPAKILSEDKEVPEKQQAVKTTIEKAAENYKRDTSQQRIIGIKQQAKLKALIEEQRSKWGAHFHIPGHKKPAEHIKIRPVKVKGEPAGALLLQKPAEKVNTPVQKVEIDQATILAKIAAIRAQRDDAALRAQSRPSSTDASPTFAVGPRMRRIGGPVRPIGTSNDHNDIDDTASDTSDLITF